ncbi:MAG TPA: PPC domain-containing protein [Thermodesulfobacteriota bacterium]
MRGRAGLTGDTFSFDATEGDEITLRHVENPSTGHLGSQATLILRNAESGSPLNEEITEDVPIEMNLTIPATGKYEIIVEQHDIPPEVWFRGDYFLKLESSGDTEEILPGEHVEH